MTTTTDRSSERPGQYKVVGTRPIRHDALDKVTGAARYGADIHLPGMLHGKILRSPHTHARIRSIDTSKAEALPGVMAVATSKDFPIIEDRVIDFDEVQGNARMIAENVLAHEKAPRVTPWQRWPLPVLTSPKRPSNSSRWTTRCCPPFLLSRMP
jgi:xanthine dehydrogenase molybdenum-binding subunit